MTTVSAAPPLPEWLGETDRMLGLLNGGFPAVHEMTAADARAAVAARARPIDNADDVASAEDTLIDGVLRVRVYRPHRTSSPAPAIVFLHGGGFVFCSIESHDGFCRRMARQTSSVVISVDYRLAPEHQAPAAAEDVVTALAWTTECAAALGIDTERIVVAGDSAGGNLAAVACLMARDRGMKMPVGQVLLYPVIAPEFETQSYVKFATDHFNTRDAMRWYWRQYVGGDDLPEKAELAAPSRATSHAGLPAAVVYVAGRDPLASEGSTYARQLSASGVAVRHRLFPDLFHGFATIAGFGPARSAQEMLWADIKTLQDRTGNFT